MRLRRIELPMITCIALVGTVICQRFSAVRVQCPCSIDPLRDVVTTGISPADRLLDKYHNEWNGDLSRIYEEFTL